MKLHYKNRGEGQPVLLLHGLLGNLDNLHTIGTSLATQYQVFQLDLRNHGLSPWSTEMNYQVMAEDIREFCDTHQLKQITVIGHSMGGKVAMHLTSLLPTQIKRIVIMDIAPVAYPQKIALHTKTIDALLAVTAANITDRREAALFLSRYLDEETIPFLLKSFGPSGWKFNLQALINHVDAIAGWTTLPSWNKPTLFIKGNESDYIQPAHRTTTLAQFPHAKLHIIANAGHNVHAEKPLQVIHAISHFLVTA